MDKPLNHMDASTTPGERPIDQTDLPKRGFIFTTEAETETIEGKIQLKVGSYRNHKVHCDEPETIGGENAYPPPLGYITLGVGF